ncbi:MAG: hypothetical protein ACHQVS_00100 [Candidatus Babeliales bacterium]
MKNNVVLAGLLTMSMVGAVHGAEKQVHRPLSEWRTAINTSGVSAESKAVQRAQLKKKIEEELAFGKKSSDTLKARRALHNLQHRVKQDQNPKSGRELIF